MNDRIVIDPDICNERPVVQGTLTTFQTVREVMPQWRKSEIRMAEGWGNAKTEDRLESRQVRAGTILGLPHACLVWSWAVAVGIWLCSNQSARSELVVARFTYPPDAQTAWPAINFDGVGGIELSFSPMMIFPTNLIGNAFRLTATGDADLELLQDQFGRALPLRPGDIISSQPQSGHWQSADQTFVWTRNERYLGIQTIGVGMPGESDFMGIRLQDGADWHYGWVEFGLLTSPFQNLKPAVVAYAYETTPGLPVTVPEPRGFAVLALCVGFVPLLVKRPRFHASFGPSRVSVGFRTQ